MNSYPHTCRMDHVEIGHSDSENEMCPLCIAKAKLTEALEVLREVGVTMEDGEMVCNSCYETDDWGHRKLEHAPGCRLAKLIGGSDGE